ncbi:D-Ala-D-Ala carboxypeptidase family metallohydrolase [Phenylobacterium sp.]|uniref:D-Ala-D-Ala carboxypeptidase family metallohydrolase n=1 Tax=Phenylobacterium sp. TaxID=1871053 RepID=UPI003928014E
MSTYLSEHFSLDELIATSHRGIDNRPPKIVVANLAETARRMEAVRQILGGRPILVTSGYRCPALNTEVGGSKTSAHLLGWAVDFICPRFGSPLDVCRVLAAAQAAGDLAFDQLIEEGTWVHISFEPRPMRGQVLTKRAGGGYALGLRF